MNLFDMHCDTAYEMVQKKQGLAENSLAVSLSHYETYQQKVQIFAVWSENTKSEDEVYHDFFQIYENLQNEIQNNKDRAMLCTDAATLASSDKRLKIIPAVEGSRLLAGDLTRLAILREYGVRVLTLTWEGHTAAGGAFDTEDGLTPFGFELLAECERLGIVVDVSHLSEKGFWDIAGRAAKPFIASHSNSAAMCAHRRNLTDNQFRTIIQHGGVVGISLVGKHLSGFLEQGTLPASEILDIVCSHIEHYLSLGGEKTVALGLDSDGTDPLPGLENVSLVSRIADRLAARGVKQKVIEDLFYNNADAFFRTMLL